MGVWLLDKEGALIEKYSKDQLNKQVSMSIDSIIQNIISTSQEQVHTIISMYSITY